MTTSGFTPKNIGFHNTISAIYPLLTSQYTPIPCAIVGLMVFRDISFNTAVIVSFHYLAHHVAFHLICSLPVRITTSPIRPIAWESELIMEKHIVQKYLPCNGFQGGYGYQQMPHLLAVYLGDVQTINISNVVHQCCFVEMDEWGWLVGNTFGYIAALMISGAWPPPALRMESMKCTSINRFHRIFQNHFHLRYRCE